MRVNFHVEGGEQLASRLHGMEARARDVRPAWTLVGDDIRRIQADMFATGGRSGGQVWEPDSAAWVRQKRDMGRSLRLLVFTGALERSFTQQRSRFSVQRNTTTTLSVGTKDPVTNLLKKKLPGGRRSLIGVRAEDQERWVGILAEHIFDGLEGVGGGLGL